MFFQSPVQTYKFDEKLVLISCRILKFFSASPDEYTVVFTSGCTAALKLVAETFDYHGNSCHGTSNLGDSDNCPEESKRGSFTYLLDNHTSVQGVREIAFQKAKIVQCIDCDKDGQLKVLNVLYEDKDGSTCECGNHLFAFPAQSNFSGRKYPLHWVAMAAECQFPWQQESYAESGHLNSDMNDSKTLNHQDSKSGSGIPGCHGIWFTVLDAASLVSTSPLDLSSVKPDFVTISFYKMFGIPSGLGKAKHTNLVMQSVLSLWCKCSLVKLVVTQNMFCLCSLKQKLNMQKKNMLNNGHTNSQFFFHFCYYWYWGMRYLILSVTL